MKAKVYIRSGGERVTIRAARAIMQERRAKQQRAESNGAPAVAAPPKKPSKSDHPEWEERPLEPGGLDLLPYHQRTLPELPPLCSCGKDLVQTIPGIDSPLCVHCGKRKYLDNPLQRALVDSRG